MTRLLRSDIELALREGLLVIQPLEDKLFSCGSVTLRLGPLIVRGIHTTSVRGDAHHLKISPRNVTQAEHELVPGRPLVGSGAGSNNTVEIDMGLGGEVTLEPGAFCVMQTLERISAPTCDIEIIETAALSHLGLLVLPHVVKAAGSGPPGEPEPISFGVTAVQPIRLTVGAPICEARFDEVIEPQPEPRVPEGPNVAPHGS